jgi:hypothetical protein
LRAEFGFAQNRIQFLDLLDLPGSERSAISYQLSAFSFVSLVRPSFLATKTSRKKLKSTSEFRLPIAKN